MSCETVKKTMKCSFATESQGKREGGKEPPSRSIKQFFKLIKFEKLDGSGVKRLFRHAEQGIHSITERMPCFYARIDAATAGSSEKD